MKCQVMHEEHEMHQEQNQEIERLHTYFNFDKQ